MTALTNESIYEEISHLNNELTNLHRDVAKKNFQLERLNGLKDQFLSVAAHDLRCPLGSIMMYSELLLDEIADGLDEEHRQFLSVINRSSRFMLDLVNGLLDVSTIESGFHLVRQPADLVRLVSRSVALNQALAKQKGIVLRFSHGQVPDLALDPQRIEQVLNNLLGNAIKFSPEGSCVRISVCKRERDAVIVVCDDGPGIAADQLLQLRQAFAHRSGENARGGSRDGLGLQIVRKIVTEHGGTIAIESEVGKGAMFSVTLPLTMIGAR
jgi:signal transduction histidine kinase